MSYPEFYKSGDADFIRFAPVLGEKGKVLAQIDVPVTGAHRALYPDEWAAYQESLAPPAPEKPKRRSRAKK